MHQAAAVRRSDNEPTLSVLFSRTENADVYGRQLPPDVVAERVIRGVNEHNESYVMVEFRTLNGNVCFREGVYFCLSARRAEQYYPGVKKHFNL